MTVFPNAPLIWSEFLLISARCSIAPEIRSKKSGADFPLSASLLKSATKTDKRAGDLPSIEHFSDILSERRTPAIPSHNLFNRSYHSLRFCHSYVWSKAFSLSIRIAYYSAILCSISICSSRNE
ncbi:hypothetical protein M2322_004404 [Rhodoblastus acidophilus]|uniref:hypothetical protein n=1 Tax=Rhodoblastus acidophilus TaxID=1074 RepID=UPI0022244E9F|nr:hypothetical protein [Rhodoblastus acidophilus]MCW2318835.1 hypothetical protein [Rhodoblastus acidophilus]